MTKIFTTIDLCKIDTSRLIKKDDECLLQLKILILDEEDSKGNKVIIIQKGKKDKKTAYLSCRKATIIH